LQVVADLGWLGGDDELIGGVAMAWALQPRTLP
jgi:hypothetical protein